MAGTISWIPNLTTTGNITTAGNITTTGNPLTTAGDITTTGTPLTTAGNITTTGTIIGGGRKLKNTRALAGNTTLGVTDNFITAFNDSIATLTITLPLVPVDGQEYKIKCILPLGGTNRVVSPPGAPQIQAVNAGTADVSFTMTSSTNVAHLIFSAADNLWCRMY